MPEAPIKIPESGYARPPQQGRAAPVTICAEPLIQDSFSRTVSNGWGSADVGSVCGTHKQRQQL